MVESQVGGALVEINQVAVTIGEKTQIQLENSSPVALTTTDGQQVLVSLSNNLASVNSILSITLIAPPINSDEEFASLILSINLVDAFGTELTSFSDSVELCFSSPTGNKSDKCLNYFNENREEWICIDSSLESRDDLIWFVFL